MRRKIYARGPKNAEYKIEVPESLMRKAIKVKEKLKQENFLGFEGVMRKQIEGRYPDESWYHGTPYISVYETAVTVEVGWEEGYEVISPSTSDLEYIGIEIDRSETNQMYACLSNLPEVTFSNHPDHFAEIVDEEDEDMWEEARERWPDDT